MFSVEFDAFKRDFIMRAHCRPDAEPEFHLFEDVSIFDPRSGDEHYCHTCGRKHEIPSQIDVLVAGPSCKNLSRMNADRGDFHECALAFSVQYSTITNLCYDGCIFATIRYNYSNSSTLTKVTKSLQLEYFEM